MCAEAVQEGAAELCSEGILSAVGRVVLGREMLEGEASWTVQAASDRASSELLQHLVIASVQHSSHCLLELPFDSLMVLQACGFLDSRNCLLPLWGPRPDVVLGRCSLCTCEVAE